MTTALPDHHHLLSVCEHVAIRLYFYIFLKNIQKQGQELGDFSCSDFFFLQMTNEFSFCFVFTDFNA